MIAKEIEKEVLRLKKLINSGSWEDKTAYEKVRRMGCSFEYDYKDPNLKTGRKIKYINDCPADLSDVLILLDDANAPGERYKENLIYFYERVNFFRLSALYKMIAWYDNIPNYENLSKVYERTIKQYDKEGKDKNDPSYIYTSGNREKVINTLKFIDQVVPCNYEYYLKMDKIYKKVKELLNNESRI